MKRSDFEYCNMNAYSLPSFGFKIHVSATIENYQEIFDLVSSYLEDRKISWKYLKTPEAIEYNFSDQESSAESGKFITIYPQNIEHLKEILEELYSLIPSDQKGIYILSDRNYKDSNCIFYRYGCIEVDETILEDGFPTLYGPHGEKWQDYQKHYFELPDWIEDIQEPIEYKPSYLSEHYQIVELLKESNGGNVYLAESKHNHQKVIIKESKPYIVYHHHLRKEELRRAEWSVLEVIGGNVPKRVENVKEWINTYYIYEYIEGTSLRDFADKYSILVYKRNRQPDNYNQFRQLLKCFHGVLKTVASLHTHGLILNDIHPDNFIINADMNVVFIDLENSYLYGERPQVGVFNETSLAKWNNLDGKEADCKKVARMFLYLLGRLHDKFDEKDYAGLETLLKQKGIQSNIHLLITYLNSSGATIDQALSLFEKDIFAQKYQKSLTIDLHSIKELPKEMDFLEETSGIFYGLYDMETSRSNIQAFKREKKLGLNGLAGVLLYLHSVGENVDLIDQIIHYIVGNMVSTNEGKGVQVSEYCISPYLLDGTAGIIQMLLKINPTKYLALSEKLAPVLLTEYAQHIGLCDGMLGLADTLLKLYSFTQKTIYIENAYELLMSCIILSDDHLPYKKEVLYLLGRYKQELLIYQKGKQL